MELQSILVLVGLIATAVAGLYIAGYAVQRGWHDGRPVMLDELLSRVGVEPVRFASEATAFEYSLAGYRCLGCQRSAQCRRWLDSEAGDGFQGFCPSAAFVQSVRRQR